MLGGGESWNRCYHAATATGDLTGAFAHAHPRLHTTLHRGRQFPDLGIGEPNGDHQPGQFNADEAKFLPGARCGGKPLSR